MRRRAIDYILLFLLITGVGLLAAASVAQAATGVTLGFAWGTNVGWINFNPSHSGVTVFDDHLEGYVWAENIGWIRLGRFTGGGSHTYGNTSNTNYGVNNDGSGNLSGFAWGTNVGWINFNPTHGGVTIDQATGNFDGYAWGENIGWIHFKKTGAAAYNVTTLQVTSFTYLPIITKPVLAELSVKNSTTGPVTYTVQNTPEGNITCTNIPAGTTQACGSFTPGTYTVVVNTTQCGSGSGPVTFAPGPVTREVKC